MFSLEDLYSAYRKAKHEAFSDGTYPCSIEFEKYERSLRSNLIALRRKLLNKSKPWYRQNSIVSGSGFLPKGIEDAPEADEHHAHFSSGDPTADWLAHFSKPKRFPAAEFRLVIRPTVEFQVISALWVLTVGRTLDSVLTSHAYGNRPRSSVWAAVGEVSASDDSYALFKPYFSGYKNWRERGLKAIEESMVRKESVVAVTMDARNYYHSISPRFLLSESFYNAVGIQLDERQVSFTRELVEALERWHKGSLGYSGSSRGAVPVGLSASKIIANVMLAELDRAIVSNLDCVYYGRYVDDVFIVFRGSGFDSADSVIRYIRKKLDGFVVLEKSHGAQIGLQYVRPYLESSEVIFTGKKQKIFMLHGPHGADLVRQIGEQIRKASSEYRLVPSLSELRQVLSDVLLASSDAATEADTLRKADGLSIRRHGLSIALRNIDAYSRDLDPSKWIEKRTALYELLLRHVVTPTGVFTYHKQIVRILAAMIACGDISAAEGLLNRFNEILRLVFDALDPHDDQARRRLGNLADYYRLAFLESAIGASTVAGFKFSPRYRKVLRRLDPTQSVFQARRISEVSSSRISRGFLLSDLGRRPYKDYWYNDNPITPRQPKVPEIGFIRQQIALVEGLRRHIVRNLRDPHWPALAFATRPPTIPEVCLMMPGLMRESDGIPKALVALRGAGVPGSTGRPIVDRKERWILCEVPLKARGKKIQVAVPSYLTTELQFKSALRGKQDLSPGRYENLTRLINSVLKQAPEIDYIALPELSVPFPWAVSIAKSLSRSGVSFICGIEAAPKKKAYRNDALVSLVTRFGGYPSHILFRQPKMELAHHEAVEVKKAGLKFSAPTFPDGRPVYLHGDFCFSVLLCSDLTNINNRRAMQGQVDGLFVLEWNPDLETFSYLIESTAHDLHAPVIQVNNRKFGDSRIRAPYRNAHDRDVVRVRGGDKDFFVVASFDHNALRKFHSKPSAKDKLFKPLPIGFKLSDLRKLVD